MAEPTARTDQPSIWRTVRDVGFGGSAFSAADARPKDKSVAAKRKTYWRCRFIEPVDGGQRSVIVEIMTCLRPPGKWKDSAAGS